MRWCQAHGTAVAAVVMLTCGPGCDRKETVRPLFSRVPFESGPQRHIYLAAALPGDRKARLLLDTGSSLSLIEPEVLRGLNLPEMPARSGPKRPLRIDSKPVNAVIIPQMSLGSLQMTRVRMLVVEPGRLKDFAADGILGMDVLSRGAVLVDCPAGVVQLWFPGQLSQSVIHSLGFRGKGMGLMPRPWYLFSVEVEFERKVKEQLLFDTGASGTRIPRGWSRKLGLRRLDRIQSRSFSELQTVNRARVGELRLGPTLFTDTLVSYPDRETTVPPTLGLNILGERRVLADFPARTLYVR